MYQLNVTTGEKMNITSRKNRHGIWFIIMVVQGGMTRIAHNGNDIFTDMSFNEVLDAWFMWMNGELVQRAFPRFTIAQREFIMTGLTQGQWDEIMAETETESENETEEQN